jgi:(1->4)-alpha-D-glucan 1-alpha-D-glucosylmutase
MKPFAATARLQFHEAFTMDDAAALVPYYASLGVSHLYASPLLMSRPGSTHGYDIVDHNRIDPELGGEEALIRLVAELRRHEMGLVLDIVPNHMGVGGADNAWWLDVLEWGRASAHAEFFDIDWDPPDTSLRGRLLAPFLGAAYGDCLANGDLTLQFDPADGRLFVGYYTHRFPINPRDYPSILLTEGGSLEEPARAFGALSTTSREAMRHDAAAAREALRSPDLARAIAECLRSYAPDTDAGRDRLHRLLERQNYRLAWWRAAADEINWRRFFDVNGLAGVRVEVPAVFDATHRTILRLYAEGLIDAVRIDHVDGLADPRGYCRKLRRLLQAAHASRPPALQAAPAGLWIEKILAPHESLSTDWLTDGTTGYDYMNAVSAVLHDPAGEAPLTALWSSLTGRPGAFEIEAREARRQILRESLSSELFSTAAVLHRIARRDLSTRDYTLTAIHRTLVEILVHFHVYRIYAGPAGIGESDRREMDWALAGARRTVRATDRELLELMAGWLSGEGLRSVPAGSRRQERLRAMVKFQQLSAPTAAKSVEDTAFYRYGRLISRNEVGSEPSQFAISATAYHAEMRDRRKLFPQALLTTATHDHKRGEDSRARLAVLSEIPDEWTAALARWTRLNAPLRRDLDGPAPDPCDEIMLYQAIVGAWPLGLAAEDRAGVAALEERLAAWQEKALREAKRHTGWALPDAAYEQACREFLTQVLDCERPSRVVQDIVAFVERIAAAGAVNGLSQTLLRLTSPGVPDLYQGTEYWDFSLVDPDNRRPVDFAARAASLEADASPASLLPHWRDGRVKQAVIARALRLRAASPGLFTQGAYTPLKIEGPRAEHFLGFVRVHEGRAAITLVTRFAARMEGVGETPLPTPSFCRGTVAVLPRSLLGRRIFDVLRRQNDSRGGDVLAGRLSIGEALTALPVALLEVR